MLSKAKHLVETTGILRFAQDDDFAQDTAVYANSIEAIGERFHFSDKNPSSLSYGGRTMFQLKAMTAIGAAMLFLAGCGTLLTKNGGTGICFRDTFSVVKSRLLPLVTPSFHCVFASMLY